MAAMSLDAHIRCRAASNQGCVLLEQLCASTVIVPQSSCRSQCSCCRCAEFSQNLLEWAGPRFAGPIAILRNWTFCLFYVMAELWGSVVVSLLFWGFANQVRRCPLRRASYRLCPSRRFVC